MALKRVQPGLRFDLTSNAVTPDEMDAYTVYTLANPATLGVNQWFGTFPVGGTSSLGTMVIVNAIPDYPRNVEFSVTGTGAGMAGTVQLYGKDQFGSPINETIAIGTAANGGTTAGTRVFAQVTVGTINFGTAVGNGTARVGLGTAGTSTIFGLPVKIAGTGDVRLIGFVAGTGAITVNGGTIGTAVVTGVHGIRLLGTLSGTQTINVWVKSTYNPENQGVVANLVQK